MPRADARLLAIDDDSSRDGGYRRCCDDVVPEATADFLLDDMSSAVDLSSAPDEAGLADGFSLTSSLWLASAPER